jgi:hypothetical protein
MINKIQFLTFLIFVTNIGFAQLDGSNQKEKWAEENLFLDGQVSEYYSGKTISGANITASASGATSVKGVSDNKGFFKMVLEYDYIYTVTFSKAGFTSKKITMNTNGVPSPKRQKVPDMGAEITLFQPNDCIQTEMLDQPIGQAIYYPETNEIDWDMEYSMSKIVALNKMLDECKILKEKEAKQKEEEYSTALDIADEAFDKDDWENATSTYKKAIALYPDRTEPKKKLELIKTEIAKKAEEEEQRAAEKAHAEAQEKAELEAELASKKAEEAKLAKEIAEKEAKEKAKEEAIAISKAAVAAKKAEKERLAKEKAHAEYQEQAAKEAKATNDALHAEKKAEEAKLAKEIAEKEASAIAKAAAAKTDALYAEKKDEEKKLAIEKDEKIAQLAKEKAEQKAAKEQEQLSIKAIKEAEANTAKIAKKEAKKEAKAKEIAEEEAIEMQKEALAQAKEAEKAKKIAEQQSKENAAAQAQAESDKIVAENEAEKEGIAKEKAAKLAQKATTERAINQLLIDEKKDERKIEIAQQEKRESTLKTENATIETKSISVHHKISASESDENRKRLRKIIKKNNRKNKGKSPQIKKHFVL